MKPQVLHIIPHPLTNKSCWRTKPWWFLIKALGRNGGGELSVGWWSVLRQFSVLHRSQPAGSHVIHSEITQPAQVLGVVCPAPPLRTHAHFRHCEWAGTCASNHLEIWGAHNPLLGFDSSARMAHRTEKNHLLARMLIHCKGYQRTTRWKDTWGPGWKGPEPRSPCAPGVWDAPAS